MHTLFSFITGIFNLHIPGTAWASVVSLPPLLYNFKPIFSFNGACSHIPPRKEFSSVPVSHRHDARPCCCVPRLPARTVRDKRPRQPVHVHAEVVQATEENIGGYPTNFSPVDKRIIFDTKNICKIYEEHSSRE